MDLETQILETLNKVKGISSLSLISQDGEGQY